MTKHAKTDTSKPTLPTSKSKEIAKTKSEDSPAELP